MVERLLHDENIKLIRGSNSQLLRGFLNQHLPSAISYKRAVGYFSSSVFEVAKEEFLEFFDRGGKIELVCSPTFSASDLDALFRSHYLSFDGNSSNSNSIKANKAFSAVRLLEWAVSTERMCIKIALVQSQSRNSIYHEKIGVLSYPQNTITAIEGSANESASAYRDNFERITVHEHSDHKSFRAKRILEDFERLWDNSTPGVEVITLHKAFQRQVLFARNEPAFGTFPPRVQVQEMELKVPAEIIKLPSRLVLRDYQQRAIDGWFKAGGKGIYSMATGSGKTITALATLEALYRRVGSPLVIVIIAPYLNLVDQWIEEARQFGLAPINCSGLSSQWMSLVESALYLNKTNQRPILSIVTTNRTFALGPFQRILELLRVRTVLVGDEVHNLGARHLSNKLPNKITLRLGLSATPQRWMDEDGTKAVQDYFGETVIDFDLEAALNGPFAALCPYVYNPILVDLDDDETEEYLVITKQLARCMVDPRGENLSDLALALLLKRSRLIASAKGKLPAFSRVFRPYKNTRYNLIYCGDGRMEIDAASSNVSDKIPEIEILRQVDAVTRLLGQDFGMNVTKYTSETDQVQRRAILRDFEIGNKQALVAIRCLDEGVDIPKVRRAFILASSTNPRQFIQRRGRVLRRAEGKDQAEIFDFIVIPPLDQVKTGTAEFRTLRNLVEREMKRVVEFARLAINGPQAIGKLRPVLERLQLLHLL